MIDVDFGDEFDWGKSAASESGNCLAVTRDGDRVAVTRHGVGIRDTKVGADITLWASPADFAALARLGRNP